MKKRYMTAALLCAALLLGSCSAGTGNAVLDAVIDDAKQITTTPARPALPAAETAAGTPAKPEKEVSPQETSAPAAYGVDLDLTQMSSTMVYATVYNMLSDPESARGESLLVDGYFAAGGNDELGTTYFFVVIPDATACCSQGLEFICEGMKYPEDFPELGADIRVRGIFERYYEDGNPYYYIKADEVKVL